MRKLRPQRWQGALTGTHWAVSRPSQAWEQEAKSSSPYWVRSPLTPSPRPSNFKEHRVLSPSPPFTRSVLVLLTSCTHGREIRGDSRDQSVGTRTDAAGAAPGLTPLEPQALPRGLWNVSEASGFLHCRPPPRVSERKGGSDHPGRHFGPQQSLGGFVLPAHRGREYTGTKTAGPAQPVCRQRPQAGTTALPIDGA